MAADADRETFEQFLETVASDVDLTAAPDEGVTLGAEVSRASVIPAPPDDVPLILLTDPGVDAGDFELRGVIGEGGMGEVRLGWQRSVGREVAVKIPRGGPGRSSRITALVREARVTGRLEHPNVVPMHGLGRTPDGTTVMVMKRVEGQSWRDLADEPALMPERFAGRDALAGHLRILMEVCDAVHFAHARGVLHRDLKLDNVLVGAFGEVYVVDWGIAVALTDDGTGHLPLARDVTAPAGTPGYMAPEMAAGQGSALGAHSDVYCLGAILHRLLVGTTRHVGRTYLQILSRAFQSEPFEYGPEVPAELAAICNRATAASPSARYPDVTAFRQAVQGFIEHRSSARLVDEAAQARAAMATARAAGDDEAAALKFGAARFALEHALLVWPQNPEARAALDGLLIEQAELAAAAGQSEQAAELLAAVVDAEGALSTRVTAVTARVEGARQQQQALGALARETDLGVFARHRGVIALTLGVLWALNGLRRAEAPPSVEGYIVDQLWMAGAIVGLIVVLRRWLWSTQINRRVSLGLVGIVTMDLCIRLAGAELGLPTAQIAALEMVVDLGSVLFLALLLDRRLLWAVAALVVGVAYGVTHLEHVFRATAANMLAGMLIIGLIWLRRPPG